MHHKRAFTLCVVPGASIASRLEHYEMSHIHPVTTTTATTDCVDDDGYRVSQLVALEHVPRLQWLVHWEFVNGLKMRVTHF